MSSFDGIRVAKARHRPSWLWLACNCLLTADVLESPCRAVSFSVTGRDICPPGNLPSPKTTIADIFGCPLVRDRVRLGADVRDSIFWGRCLEEMSGRGSNVLHFLFSGTIFSVILPFLTSCHTPSHTARLYVRLFQRRRKPCPLCVAGNVL